MGKKYSEQDICNELIKYITNSLVDGSVVMEKETAFTKIGLDSSSVIELVLFIERKFQVAIPETDLVPDNLKSVAALAQCTYKYI